MAFEDIQFPVYRKYKNGKSYFKIISRNQFEEIQLVGPKFLFHTINAVQLPEMNHVFDLVYDKGLTKSITEEEYQKIKALAKP